MILLTDNYKYFSHLNSLNCNNYEVKDYNFSINDNIYNNMESCQIS